VGKQKQIELSDEEFAKLPGGPSSQSNAGNSAPLELSDEEFSKLPQDTSVGGRAGLQNLGGGTTGKTYKDYNYGDLNWLQKGEKALESVGLVKPTQEMFSPGALENQKAVAPKAVAGAGVAALAMTPLGQMILATGGKQAVKFIKEAKERPIQTAFEVFGLKKFLE